MFEIVERFIFGVIIWIVFSINCCIVGLQNIRKQSKTQTVDVNINMKYYKIKKSENADI